jgi:hypothetical protein
MTGTVKQRQSQSCQSGEKRNAFATPITIGTLDRVSESWGLSRNLLWLGLEQVVA